MDEAEVTENATGMRLEMLQMSDANLSSTKPPGNPSIKFFRENVSVPEEYTTYRTTSRGV
jgi:hypothetical protein